MSATAFSSSALSYAPAAGASRAATLRRRSSVAVSQQPGWFAQLIAAMFESRARSAERELRRHRQMMFVSDTPAMDLSATALPFNR
jgi:hypothetical protein